MSGDQLNLTIRQSFHRRVSNHLMAEQVRMQGLCNAGFFTILLDDLLDAPSGESSVASRFKQMPILRVGPQMAMQTRRRLFGNRM